jgi:ABC-type glycerol-3-phosphate transport system permease component
VIVAAMVIVANLMFNAAAGYALTNRFDGKRWIILLILACMMIT